MRGTAVNLILPVSLAILMGSASAAFADGFDDAVKKATPIHNTKGMTALFWSQQASCAKSKGDLLRRQCQGVRDARRSKVSERTYVLDIGGAAIEVKPDAKAKSVSVTLRACLACDKQGPIVLGSGPHKLSGKSISAAPVASKTKSFKNPANAEHWGKHIATRLRAQVLVKVPTSVDRFSAGSRTGYKVKVVGYRLYDPCQGRVLTAKPASNKGPVSVDACKDEPAMKIDDPKSDEPKIQHPSRLSTAQIKKAMGEVGKLAKKCHAAYGIEGMATFKMVIGASGKLKKVDQSGDFAGTPTGICLDEAMKVAIFPKSKKASTPITYPIVLQ